MATGPCGKVVVRWDTRNDTEVTVKYQVRMIDHTSFHLSNGRANKI